MSRRLILNWAKLGLAARACALLAAVAWAYALSVDDVCLTEDRAFEIPEGSSGNSRWALWPPAAVRCHWETVDGRVINWTVAPDLAVYLVVCAVLGLVTWRIWVRARR